ncbi:MAG: dihydroxy-acid dehydratase [Phycisphaerae bacterium]|nr:dihydroxy-acid dehydratase [Phycisphaerae bacterium]
MRSDRIKRGPERAPHRSLLKATGNYSDADLDKPFIAIANSYVDIVPGHAHLDKVGQFIKECVREAGGVPFVFNTIGVDDGIAMGHRGMKFSLPSRELIADAVETMVEAHCFDGLLCIPNCDKIIPGMLMAAARCNIPTLFVSGGPMEAGRTADGRKVDLISAFTAVAGHARGEVSEAQLRDIENNACPTCGSCSGLFTANSMNCLCEALGIALPGNGTVLATSVDRIELYRQAARRIVELVREDLKARDVLTLPAFDNAMVLDMAMGGSTNTVLHIPAVAHAAGITYDLARINDLSQRTPTLCKIAPSAGKNGRMYHMEDLQAAGGIMTLMGELARGTVGLVDGNCRTVTGRTLAENIAAHDLRAAGQSVQVKGLASAGRIDPSATDWADQIRSAALRRKPLAAVEDHQGPLVLAAIAEGAFDPYDCVRTMENAYSPEGGLAILYGNLAPDGSVVKTAGVDANMLVHSGPAVLFESQEAACEGILAGRVKAGDVVVIRNEGPKGGPGMQEMLAPTSYIKGAGLGDKCALITDGRFSGGTAGACIGHISPEAAAGGPIGLLENGDVIEIDIPRRRLDVRLSDDELARRRAAYKPPERKLTGYLAKYASMVTSATTGAVLEC